MRSRRGAAVLISAGCLFLFAALALGGYNLWDDHRAAQAADGVLRELQATRPADPEAPPDYLLNPYMDMPTVQIGRYLYIGELTVPALGLELPVMDRWDYTRMKTAPCRYAGSAYLKNLVLCAHNYASHFGRLKNLSPGDRVTFTDAAGNVFSYQVDSVENLAPTAVSEMKDGGWDLTLFTCTIDGRARVAVRCRQVQMAVHG